MEEGMPPRKTHADYLSHIGETYGRLTIETIEPESSWARSGKFLRPTVKARCECGGSWSGKLNSLKSGNTTSCGCAHLYGDHSHHIGRTYNRITITEIAPRSEWVRINRSDNRRKHASVPVVHGTCSCGNAWKGRLYALVHGTTKSCGCATRDQSNPRATKHGLHRTPEYGAWVNMKKRCYSKSHKSYEHYGARGVTVCDRWRESFENFYADMGPRPGPEFSIDRIDNDRGYEPGNCRWATSVEQANNRRGCTCVEVDGKSMTISELARAHSLPRRTVADRLKRGLSPTDAVKTRTSRR